MVVTVALLLLVIVAVVGLAQPLATQWVLEALGEAQSLRNPVLILVGSVLGAAAAQGIGQFLMLRVAEDVVLGTRRQMVRQILGLSVGAMHKREPGELMSRVISDSASVRQIALQSVTQSVTGTVVIIGSIGMMVYLDWFLFLLTFAVIAGLCMALFFIMPQIRKSARKTQTNIGAVSNEMERALGTFTTVKASDAEEVEVEAIGRQASRARNSGIRTAMWTALAGMTSALTVQAAFLVVLGVGGAAGPVRRPDRADPGRVPALRHAAVPAGAAADRGGELVPVRAGRTGADRRDRDLRAGERLPGPGDRSGGDPGRSPR